MEKIINILQEIIENAFLECEYEKEYGKVIESNRPDLANNEQVTNGVEDEMAKGLSLLNTYRYAINIRNKYPIFKHGVFTNMTSQLNTDNKNVLAYKISLGNEYLIVVHNFGLKNVEVNALGSEVLETINVGRKIPELSGGKLRLGMRSCVILH